MKTATKKSECELRYEIIIKEINQKLDQLKTKVKRHQKEFNSTDKLNWGFVGDMGYINEELSHLIK